MVSSVFCDPSSATRSRLRIPVPLRATGNGAQGTGLHLDLDVLALEPLDHELVLLARGEARAHRFPWPPCADAAVFRLGDADEALLRRRVDRMVVDRVAPLELPGDSVLARQA